MKNKILKSLPFFWLGFAFPAILDVSITTWQWWAVIVPAIILIIITEDLKDNS